MNVIGYTEEGMIRVVFDDDEAETFIPDDSGNRHRQMIAEWEAAGNTIPPYVAPGPSTEDVVAERERRLALGFDFDFGDARGVHRIGTSLDDMRKWMDEVTPLAQVYLNGGQPGSEITITTETGVAVITANEWQSILIAAAGYRQPLYAASFALQAMDPIPSDFATNPAYWP